MTVFPRHEAIEGLLGCFSLQADECTDKKAESLFFFLAFAGCSGERMPSSAGMEIGRARVGNRRRLRLGRCVVNVGPFELEECERGNGWEAADVKTVSDREKSVNLTLGLFLHLLEKLGLGNLGRPCQINSQQVAAVVGQALCSDGV